MTRPAAQTKPSAPTAGLAALAPANLEDYESFPAYQQTYLLSYLQIADEKAAIFLAVTSGALAFIASHYGVTWLRQHPFTSHYLLLSIASLLLIASALHAVAVVVPRMRDMTNPLHFRSVSALQSEAAYVDEVLSTSAEDLLRHQIAQCWQLSRVCARKYRLLYRSLFLGAGGYLFFVAALFWRV